MSTDEQCEALAEVFADADVAHFLDCDACDRGEHDRPTIHAQALLASPAFRALVAGEREAAWDEGRSFGARDRQMYEVGDGCGPDAWDCDCPNPYRADREMP